MPKSPAAPPVTTLQLPTDHPRPPMQTFRGASESLRLPASLTDRLKALSQHEGTTLFITLLAGFKALLSRYTGQDDLVVCRRNEPEFTGEVRGLLHLEEQAPALAVRQEDGKSGIDHPDRRVGRTQVNANDRLRLAHPPPA